MIKHENILKSSLLDTPIGTLLAVSDEEKIYLLAFHDSQTIDHTIEQLKQKTASIIIPEYSKPIASIEVELNLYFEGKLKKFKTPLHMTGTPFQKLVWEALLTIPHGKTVSYLAIAKAINKPSACRAVARANAANLIPIVIPCHRVINTNGDLGGYNGGINRKDFLLQHELDNSCTS
jgi:O-6-methylguanine DNA methyltransferase